MTCVFSLLLVNVKSKKIWPWEIPTPKIKTSLQEVLPDGESEMFDENEDIALTFRDKKNINHITFDKYVAKMTVELKLI